MKEILNYVPQEVFNYQDYLELMESKKVRHGKDRTHTLLDFVTPEQQEELNDKGINDLSSFDPTPKEINEHFDFIFITLQFLRQANPNDEYLESLANDESMQVEYCSKDWYKKYGIEK